MRHATSLIGGIDPVAITDATTHETVDRLLNVVEQLVSEVARLSIENQRLRDENNRWQGEPGKPTANRRRLIIGGGTATSETTRITEQT